MSSDVTDDVPADFDVSCLAGEPEPETEDPTPLFPRLAGESVVCAGKTAHLHLRRRRDSNGLMSCVCFYEEQDE